MWRPRYSKSILRRSTLSVRSTPPNGVRTWSALTAGESSLKIHALNISFPYIWLRDSCQSSPECIHPTTSQKLHRTSDIPIDIRPIVDGTSLTDDGVLIKWTDGHESHFHRSFLERHSSAENLSKFHRDISRQSWNASSIQSTDLFLPYKFLQTPEGLMTAITQLSRFGLLFISTVPNLETANETCELRTLAELFGDIRTTFYGPLWDVMNIRNSRNIAYTNLHLGLHMDLLYFEHPPRYQILHCLRNRVSGGTSIFVDALQAASKIRESHPTDFEVLASTPVAFHYINDGHHLHHEHPTIELTHSTMNTSIDYVNYSPPFQAPLALSTPAAFYPAFGRFTKLLNDPTNMYQYTLREGDAVLFDNRRIVHARTSFEDVQGQGKDGEPNRWLKGCYFDADAFMDRARVLKSKIERTLP